MVEDALQGIFIMYATDEKSHISELHKSVVPLRSDQVSSTK